jgi:hypothetical protein
MNSVMHGCGDGLTAKDRDFLVRLQRQAISYFTDNQTTRGLILDRQSNYGPRRLHGLCSTAATGMGFIALALGSAEPYRLLSATTAIARLRDSFETVLETIPHEQGVVPHFIDSATGEVHGADYFSTVETAWIVAGALWAAAFLKNPHLERLANRIYHRVDWQYWATPSESQRAGLIRHGKDRYGHYLPCYWDRLNGETAFMYILAAGAENGRAIDETAWTQLQPFYGTIAGLHFNNADLGLFVFQYGLDLLDLQECQAPGHLDLHAEAGIATRANYRRCREVACNFATYRRFWGLSSGDGPGEVPGTHRYRCYTPSGPIDGTAHLMATVASVAHETATVLDNLYEAERDDSLGSRGRYGYSNVNLDHAWVGTDMVGIDAGAAVLAIDNFLVQSRVRGVFQSLPMVRRGLERLHFPQRSRSPIPSVREKLRRAG